MWVESNEAYFDAPPRQFPGGNAENQESQRLDDWLIVGCAMTLFQLERSLKLERDLYIWYDE
jgi:hypothetical protein